MASHLARADSRAASPTKYNRAAFRRSRPSHASQVVAPWVHSCHHEELTEQQRPQSREGEHQRKSLRRRILRSGLLIDKKAVSLFFRFVSLLNLISLAISLPIWNCQNNSKKGNSLYNCYVHFAVIASVDAVLAVVFTVHLLLRVFYELWWKLEVSMIIQSRSSWL